MKDPMQELFKIDAKATLFQPNSRYCGIDTATLRAADGRAIAYIRRRFIPQPERLVLHCEHVVVRGDRLDNLAHKYLGDPELFWRICDANNAMRPGELTERIGRVLRITLPEGIPGVSNA